MYEVYDSGTLIRFRFNAPTNGHADYSDVIIWNKTKKKKNANGHFSTNGLQTQVWRVRLVPQVKVKLSTLRAYQDIHLHFVWLKYTKYSVDKNYRFSASWKCTPASIQIRYEHSVFWLVLDFVLFYSRIASKTATTKVSCGCTIWIHK